MSGAACSSSAVRFVAEPSSYIVCQLCKKVFSNPVINVRCGHTYCMACLTKPSAAGDSLAVVRCPEDGVECNVTDLVLNRLVLCFFAYYCVVTALICLGLDSVSTISARLTVCGLECFIFGRVMFCLLS